MDDKYDGPPGKVGETGMHSFRASTYVTAAACFLLLLLAVFAGAVLLDAQVADAAQQKTPDLVEDGGRQISATDWLYHLPLAIGAAIVVIVVDAIVILKIVLRRGRNR